MLSNIGSVSSIGLLIIASIRRTFFAKMPKQSINIIRRRITRGGTTTRTVSPKQTRQILAIEQAKQSRKSPPTTAAVQHVTVPWQKILSPRTDSADSTEFQQSNRPSRLMLNDLSIIAQEVIKSLPRAQLSDQQHSSPDLRTASENQPATTVYLL